MQSIVIYKYNIIKWYRAEVQKPVDKFVKTKGSVNNY